MAELAGLLVRLRLEKRCVELCVIRRMAEDAATL
jgi:hypothetical protein